MDNESKKYEENPNRPNQSLLKGGWKYFIGLGLGILLSYFFLQPQPNKSKNEAVETHSIIRDRVASMGKIELIKYQFQNMISHEVVREWLPDPSVRLFAYGEAVGCIDLARVDSQSVMITLDTVYLTLPEPEVCYTKIDHEKSHILYTQYTFFETAKLVDEAYIAAERELLQAAHQSHILESTKNQAEEMLPIYLRPFTDKVIKISFDDTSFLLEKKAY